MGMHLKTMLISAALLCSSCSQNGPIPPDQLLGCWTAQGVGSYKDTLSISSEGTFKQEIRQEKFELTRNGSWRHLELKGTYYIIFNGITLASGVCVHPIECVERVKWYGTSVPWSGTEWPAQPERSLFSGSWELPVNTDTGHRYKKTECETVKSNPPKVD